MAAILRVLPTASRYECWGRPPISSGRWRWHIVNAALCCLFILTAIEPAHGAYLPVSYDSNGFFHLNSGQSDYVGYRPSNYNEATPISLFVWMHGCGGNAEGDMWSIAPPSTRQTQSYIAISIGGRDGACWSVNTDSPKVLAAITDVARYFNINPRKIYLGGYSSGGDMTYRVGLQNASVFAGLLVENCDPFRDTGVTSASLMASASWKINVAHLAHLSDTTYPIAGVRTNLATLAANGFPVAKIEKAGTHYDPDNGSYGTNYDLIHFLLPYLNAGWVSPTASGGAATSGIPDLWTFYEEEADRTRAYYFGLGQMNLGNAAYYEKMASSLYYFQLLFVGDAAQAEFYFRSYRGKSQRYKYLHLKKPRLARFFENQSLAMAHKRYWILKGNPKRAKLLYERYMRVARAAR